ncbi:Transposase [Shigella dysenteriae 1617]|uniref:Transposase n=1 Tax=Shigella dysenteriae 1617 TaxID=754093 RepID=A0A0A6ZQS8_SHIDY|nr:Transposase [Shigella dysenteriae 1617]
MEASPGTAYAINIGMITSDDWGSYGREVPKDKHLTGKIFTQRIERK